MATDYEITKEQHRLWDEWEVRHKKFEKQPNELKDALFYLSPHRDAYTQEWLDHTIKGSTDTPRMRYRAIVEHHNE